MPKRYKLDLHNFKPIDYGLLEIELEFKLDSFLRPLLNLKSCKIEIVVGKGLNSKRFINGKNPLRFYTEKYLQKLNLDYKEGGYFEGQDGVLIVHW
jgi:hypothetical protein